MCSSLILEGKEESHEKCGLEKSVEIVLDEHLYKLASSHLSVLLYPILMHFTFVVLVAKLCLPL